MANPTVEQLSEVVTFEEAEAFLLKAAQKHGIIVTSWGDGSAPRDFLKMCAEWFADRTRITSGIAKSGFNQTAEDGWLTVFSDSQYDNQRNKAVRAKGYFQLVVAADAPLPINIAKDEKVIVDRESEATFRVNETLTITVAGTQQVMVIAELAGLDGNIVTGIDTLELQTPISGVSVTNEPNQAGGTPVDSWMLIEGAEEEKNDELRLRNTSKWATLAFATGPRDAYVYWAVSAPNSEAVTRVQVNDDDATAKGKVIVYVAGARGSANSATVNNVADYIKGNPAKGMVRRHPIGSNVEIKPAVEIHTYVLSLVIYCDSAYQEEIGKLVKAAVEDYIHSVPIGGTKTDPLSLNGHLFLGQVYRAACEVPGVINVTFSPTSDVAVPEGHIIYPRVVVADVVPVQG